MSKLNAKEEQEKTKKQSFLFSFSKTFIVAPGAAVMQQNEHSSKTVVTQQRLLNCCPLLSSLPHAAFHSHSKTARQTQARHTGKTLHKQIDN